MGTLAAFVNPEGVLILENSGKTEALARLCEAACRGTDLDVERVRRGVFEREAMLSTGIGLGIALPHVRLPEADRFVLSVGLFRPPIEYGSLDGKPVEIALLLVGPSRSHEEFVRFVARVTGVLKQEAFREALLAAATPAEAWEVLDRY